MLCYVNLFEEKVHPGDLARGCSDLEMTWLLCCAGAATALSVPYPSRRQHLSCRDCLEAERGDHQNCSVLYCGQYCIV